MPLLVITLQHLRDESEIYFKHSTVNRRQSASSELCNHHIIHYELAVLFLPVSVVMSGVLFIRPAPFGCFPPQKQTCICCESLRESMSILLSLAHKLDLLALKETSTVFCVCVCRCMHVCLCLSQAGESN